MTQLVATEVELWPGAGLGPAWTLESDDVSLTVTAHGAHVIDVRMRVDDVWHRVSVDYPDGEDPGGFHGATVGRWANRIAGARYTHEGAQWELAPNEGPHLLHGGPDGFHHRQWALLDLGRSGVTLELTSPDGDQGFPGEVRATADFRLEGNELQIVHQASASEPTPLNLTSHLYWNLHEPGTLAGHILTIPADTYVRVDDANIPVPGPPHAVDGTSFDCRNGRDLGEITASGGYDHCFVLASDRQVITLEHTNGRQVQITTDQPGLQVYTGMHLDAHAKGVALETQRIPDGPNRPDFGPAIGTSFSNTTTYRLSSE